MESVPIIDGAHFLLSDEPPSPQLVDLVATALSTWGFFQLRNHGVDQSLLQRHLAAVKRFFALPHESKEAVARRVDNAMGFNSRELTKQKLDVKQVFDYRLVPQPGLPDDHPDNSDSSGINQWPAGDEEFRRLNEEFSSALASLGFKLLQLISLALGLQPHALDHLFAPKPSTRVRLNFYPVTPKAAADSFGVSHHKDSGFLTLLLQDEEVAGLQVHHQGVWHDVTPLPGCLTINGGDMLQVLSNDRFVAANHRVLRSTHQDRYSRVMFFNPSPGAVIQPMLATAGGKGGDAAAVLPHYRPIPWTEWYLARLDGNYANLGEEVQIDWYRTATDKSNGSVPAAAAMEDSSSCVDDK